MMRAWVRDLAGVFAFTLLACLAFALACGLWIYMKDAL